MKIKNINGSSKVSAEPPVGYTSWLNYWEIQAKFTLVEGKKYKCPACKNDFERKNFDGCHVQKVNSIDKKWYIIPLCDKCNHRIDTPDIDERLLINVPSNLKS